jgi:hypothetical protein
MQTSKPIHSSRKLLRLGAVALLLASPSAFAGNANGHLTVLPPNSNAFGRSYGAWSEAFWQWSFSLPVDHHPLFDTADVSTGQSGNVWFIGGGFTSTPVTRSITIPAGTALFFPLLTAWADNTDCNGGQMISDGNSETFLRGLVESVYIDSVQTVSCVIDGVPVRGLSDPATSPYLFKSPTPGGFSYIVPSSDNVLNFLGLPCWTDPSGNPITVSANIYHPVAEGFYILLAPLSVGQHTIHGFATNGSFTQDFTYNITVAPNQSQGDSNQQ